MFGWMASSSISEILFYLSPSISPYHRGENPIHQPLVGCVGVLQPKGHNFVIVTGELRPERSLTLIAGVHMDLVVPSRMCLEN